MKATPRCGVAFSLAMGLQIKYYWAKPVIQGRTLWQRIMRCSTQKSRSALESKINHPKSRTVRLTA